jgi:opacity protein-like surface antigen
MAARVTFVCVLLILQPVKTWAEGFLDVYGGPSIGGTADVRVSESTSAGTRSAQASIDLSSAASFGIRAGLWFPTYNWIGFGMDFGYLKADGPGVSIDAFPLSLLLALRAPLFATPDRPGGRLQPYVMGGISLYAMDASVQYDGMGGSTFKGNWYLDSSAPVKAGPYLAAGLTWAPSVNVAVFAEYRYSHFNVGFDTTNSYILPTENGRVDTSVTTRCLLFGVSYRLPLIRPVGQNNEHRT